jgi:hypothetical protein
MTNSAIDDMVELFSLGGKVADDDKSSDYSSTADADVMSKASFDELAEEIGDSIEGADAFSLPRTGSEEVEKEESVAEVKEEKQEEVKPKFFDPTENKPLTADEPESKEEPKPVQETQKEETVMDNEKMIKDAISVSEDEEESYIDHDSVFGNSGSSKEESEVEVGISSSETNSPTTEEPKVAEEVTESLSPEETEAKTDEKKEDSKETIPFDSPTLTAQKTAQPKSDSSIRVKNGVKFVDDQIEWILTPPTDKYKSFYESKSEALEAILPGGQIPFEKYKEEFRNAKVDISVSDADMSNIYDRMRSIQQWRERITFISLHVNEQYFLWDRYIEMLHGVLARVEYEKPMIKQEGVIFQHMRDLELYFASLKSLHTITASIVKNLDSSWDMLSRSVTLLMGESNRSESSRYERKEDHRTGVPIDKAPQEQKQEQIASTNSEPTQKSQSIDELLGDFDGLDGTDCVKAPSKQKGSQTVDW